MMEEVEAGRVEAIVVKDMSRLGRDYLKVGQIMEILRIKGVRLIAINDGVDSANGENDFTPFLNIMYEFYARDTSRKIKSVFKAKGMSGKEQAERLEGKESILLRLWQARQEMDSPDSRYGKIKDLKEQGALYSLLQGNGITTMRQLHENISAMNKSYYDLRGKIVSTERRIKVLDEHLSMWEQYEEHKGIRRQLDKVKPGKKGQFEQRHETELALYEAAARYLEKLKSGGEALPPKKWRAELEKLTAQKEIHYQEMRAMREQIKAVENLRKAADRLERSQQDRNRKKEDNQL